MSLLPALPTAGSAAEALKGLTSAAGQSTPASPAGLSLQEGAQASTASTEAALAGPEAGTSAAPVEGSSFGSALSEAITSLQNTQQSAASASQALALGTVKDPEQAVMTVEDAQMAMDLAAQIRTKATEAVQTIFQTQV